MFKIAEKDHCSSNPGWNPGSDPSSNPGSDSSSNPGSNPGSKFRYPPSNLKLPSNRLRTLNVSLLHARIFPILHAYPSIQHH